MKNSLKNWPSIFLSTILILPLLVPISPTKTQAAEEEEWKEISISNGSFEQEVSDVTDIPGWDYWTSGVMEGATISETEAADGSQSLRMENTGATGLFSQGISITEESRYKITGQIYLEEIEEKPGIWFRWYDANGDLVNNDAKYFENLSLNSWQQVELSAIAPIGATTLKVFIYASSNTSMTGYFDQLQLFQKQTLQPREELQTPFEFGDPIDLGPATLAAKTQGAVIGNGEIYFATNGSPSTFYAVDAYTGEVNFSQSMPGNDVVWALTVGSDGNVYFGGTNNGILYRYLPDEQRVENLGANPSENWMWDLEATEDGKIYGATYPNAKMFEYDIHTGEFNDYGRLHDEQDYVRGLGVSEEYVYAGIGTTAYLYKIDRETGEKTEINLPITGSQGSVSNIWEYNDRLFIAHGTSLLIIDKETEEVYKQLNWQNRNTFDGMISAPSPYDENLIYYRNKNTHELWTYNMETNETQAVEPAVELPRTPVKGMKWITQEDGSQVLAMIHQQTEYSLYNPQTNTVEVQYPEVDMQGINIQSLETGEDNNIYLSGYQGSIAVYNTSADDFTLQERDPHQIEGMGFLNGKVYMGAYGGARIYEYDPAKDYQYTDGQAEDNPKLIYDMPKEQSRPFTFASGDNLLFIGTTPDYGEYGGALGIYDSVSGEGTTIRNIVQDQSVVGLAYKDGTLFGGSSIFGGLGNEPLDLQAKMFEYSVSSGEYETFDLNIEGFHSPEMIGELSFGPDGNLWGSAYGYDENEEGIFTVFSMDPETREVVKSTLLYQGEPRASRWRPFFMRWDDQGFLYTTVGRKLTMIDPETMQSKKIIEDTVHLMDLDKEGNIYYANGANLFKLPVPMEDVAISSENSSLKVGQTTQIDLSATLANKKNVQLTGADIKFESSNKDVAQVDNKGNVTGITPGSADVWATVNYNGNTLITDKINFTVLVNASFVEGFLDQLEESGKLNHSSKMQLQNKLKQAMHHAERGELGKTKKHLQDFLKHLEKVDGDIRKTLESYAASLMEEWIE